jgi:aspartate carbamoyltransferase regulatory subunit
MSETVLYVSKIRNGTVIDHIMGGHALDVAKILGITRREKKVITIAIQEVHKIALLAPHATINIIRDYKVVEKQMVKLPNLIENIIRCTNPACISNSNEPVKAKFYVESDDPLLLKCYYCGCIIEKKDVLQQF